MQDKYSLAYAMTKDGQGAFSKTIGAKTADSVNPGPLVSEGVEDATTISSMSLELTNAGLELRGLSLSLGLLRNSVDTLKNSLSRFKSVAMEPSLTRAAMTLNNVQSLDPVAAFQQSFTAPPAREKTVTELRETSSKSEERLSKTLESVPVLGEETWLQYKTRAMESTNSWVGESPAAAQTLKTTGAVMSSVVSGLGDTIKSRVTGNVVDLTLGKLPGGLGKLFKSDGFKEEKSCCCANATQASPSSRRPPRTKTKRGKPQSNRPKPQKRSKPQKPQKKQTPAPKLARTPRAPAKSGGRLVTLRESFGRGVQSLFSTQSLGFNAGAPTQALQPRAAQATHAKRNAASYSPPPVKQLGLIEALDRGLVPMPAESRAAAQPHIPTSSHERLAAPVAHPPKIPTSGLMGAMSKLESVGARRLGPMRYVDTAMDVVEGVRNGDAKAVASGLSTAGGAWAGASAGAAIGTLVFPGVGTAVGGAIGGLLGSEAGSCLGDKLFGSNDRLPAPADVSKNLNNAQADNRQVTIAPQITINAPEQASYQQLAELVVQQIEAQFSPLSMDDLLGSRRDAVLTDIGGL